MTSKDRVLLLCGTHGIAISQLEKRLGYANNYFKRLKKELPYDRAVAVADFFGTSVDYILTGEEVPKPSTTGEKYYFNDETAAAAQELFEEPGLRLLFDAARGSDPEALKLAADMLRRMKGEK